MTSSTVVSARVKTPSSMSRWEAPRSGSSGRGVEMRVWSPLSTQLSNQSNGANGVSARRARGNASDASCGATAASARGAASPTTNRSETAIARSASPTSHDRSHQRSMNAAATAPTTSRARRAT